MRFSFSDLVSGYVTSTTAGNERFGLRTTDGREFEIKLTPTTYAELIRNLGEPYQDATAVMRDAQLEGRYLFIYGIYYPEGGAHTLDAKHIIACDRDPHGFRFEKQDWWIRQIRQLANFYIRAEFGEGGPINFRDYRTKLGLGGAKTTDFRQETDTISRLVYGMATAYLMTGDDRYLEVAEAGTRYLRDHMRFVDTTEDIVYWYHAIDVDGPHERKVFASEFGDDYDAIPAYEQIYALAGPVQTYRATGDPAIMRDVERTIRLFDRHFLDPKLGGYFSHIDPITLDPRAPSLGGNRARKNWNSVGDHAPAYLINLYLATGDERWARFLEYTFDTITEHFQDYDNSPFVQEKFYEDWSHDTTWGWQQNRGVVGHNLKIAWNLMRMNSLRAKDEYVAFAEKIAALMPQHGMDKQRGGWYDVMERTLGPGEEVHRFVWHDRKAWWQQEQGVLAYLILAGCLRNEEYRRLARESAAFYNAFFLDHDEGGVYFNVLANGLPYLLGTERFKGSHSMSGYHSFELAYLAAVYTNLLLTHEPMDFFFKPLPGAFKDNLLHVAPDILPPGSVRIGDAWIDDAPYTDFDADGLTVKLPQTDRQVRVRVRLVPVVAGERIRITSEVTDGVARMTLSGALEARDLAAFEDELQELIAGEPTRVEIDARELAAIAPVAMRALVFFSHRLGPDCDIVLRGASPEVRDAFANADMTVLIED